MLPAAAGAPNAEPHDAPWGPASERRMRRIFEPIPRSAAYLAGLGLVLLLLAPFWLDLIGKSDRGPDFLNDDESDLAAASRIFTNRGMQPLLAARAMAGGSALNQFHGIRLDAGREELQRQFTLHLQNTRGMKPEIYQAVKTGDVELLTAYFYDNALKEFVLFLHDRVAIPNTVEHELRDELGAPIEQADAANGKAGTGLGFGLTGGLNILTLGEELRTKLAGFTHQRQVIWTNEQNRIEATIYYTSTDPASCRSLVAIRVSAAAWLNGARSRLEVVSPTAREPSGQLEMPLTPQPAAPPPPPPKSEPPPRLFP